MNWERCSGHRREARGERRDAGDTDKAPGEGDLARNVQKPEGKGENPRRFSPVSASGSWSRGSYCIVPGLDSVEEIDHPRRSSLRVDEFATPTGAVRTCCSDSPSGHLIVGQHRGRPQPTRAPRVCQPHRHSAGISRRGRKSHRTRSQVGPRRPHHSPTLLRTSCRSESHAARPCPRTFSTESNVKVRGLHSPPAPGA